MQCLTAAPYEPRPLLTITKIEAAPLNDNRQSKAPIPPLIYDIFPNCILRNLSLSTKIILPLPINNEPPTPRKNVISHRKITTSSVRHSAPRASTTISSRVYRVAPGNTLRATRLYYAAPLAYIGASVCSISTLRKRA